MFTQMNAYFPNEFDFAGGLEFASALTDFGMIVCTSKKSTKQGKTSSRPILNIFFLNKIQRFNNACSSAWNPVARNPDLYIGKLGLI
jgi:hypothetical protein